MLMHVKRIRGAGNLCVIDRPRTAKPHGSTLYSEQKSKSNMLFQLRRNLYIEQIFAFINSAMTLIHMSSMVFWRIIVSQALLASMPCSLDGFFFQCLHLRMFHSMLHASMHFCLQYSVVHTWKYVNILSTQAKLQNQTCKCAWDTSREKCWRICLILGWKYLSF